MELSMSQKSIAVGHAYRLRDLPRTPMTYTNWPFTFIPPRSHVTEALCIGWSQFVG